MKYRISIFVAAFLSIGSMASADCTIGHHADHLNIHQVMINFGRALAPADTVALRGLRNPETVTDAQLNHALSALQLATDCADAVIANPTGDLLPDAAASLKDKEHDDYVKDFVMFMGDFKDEIENYRNSLAQLIAVIPVTARNFHALDQERRTMDDLVDHAHRKTTPEHFTSDVAALFFNDDLKDVMKQIGNLNKLIGKSIGDASQKATNASRAGEMATLFEKSATFTPDAIASLPAKDQATALADYKSLLKKEAAQARQLQAAFSAGDTAKATAIMNDMKAGKKSGHDKYNP